MKSIKQWFKSKKKEKKPMTDKEKKANPTNLRAGIQTIKNHRKRRDDMMKEMFGD